MRVLPLPQGNLTVRWHVHNDILFMEVEVPNGLRYEVKPRGRLARKRLILNGVLYE